MESQGKTQLTFSSRSLNCTPYLLHGAHVMGILNVTPDSFSDGGRYTTVNAALRHAETMLQEGAAIIDIGGESTRPGGQTYGEGAAAVAENMERERVLPVIEALGRTFPDAILSIDTYKPLVARDALSAGAHIINDITGLRLYPEMAEVAASCNAPLILMHSLGKPGEMPHEHTFTNVTQEVYDDLTQAIDTAKSAGVNQIIIDPGFGFGKSPRENMRLIKDLGQFLKMGFPILAGVSRKSTIGVYLGDGDQPVPVSDRLNGTLGVTAAAVINGATIIRTHDVRPTVELLKTLGGVMNA